MIGGFRLGSIFGFEIRIDASWFLIFFLILWSFSASVFPSQYPQLSSRTHLLMGAAGTLLFFASLLAHELSHSLVARAKGIPVEGITLFIFGGMAHTRMEAADPGDEFSIAGVGPLASFGIAAVLGAVWWLGIRLGWSVAIVGVAGYVGFLNALLAVFNLLPGFPLDGGRLFRALVWKLTGDMTKATRWASAGGTGLAYLLMGLGLLQLFGGATLGGLWLIFIGWFLRNAAIMSLRQHLVRNILEGVRVRELMTPEPSVVPPDLTIAELVASHLLAGRHQSFPVVEDGRAVGLVTLQHVKQVPREEWDARLVRDAMRGTEGLTSSPEERATDVLERMEETGERRVLVIDDGRLVGILAASDLARWIQRSEELESLGAGLRRKA